MSLKSKLLLQCILALIFVAAMFFVPAGSVRFWQGWAYIGIVFIPMFAASFYFYKYDPELVASRMQRKEKVREQKVIMRLANLLFFVCLLLPGLDHRYGWSHMASSLTIVSQVLALGGYLMTLWVMKANRFASRIIEVKVGQQVISSGPYRIVRHPMYLGAIVMFLSTPLALGSYWTLPAFALVIPVIVLRLLNEEKILNKELPGYSEYRLRTRFRLIPRVW
jgi:protein-S-isoprenylcysteine O-methyltransferase Ste14